MGDTDALVAALRDVAGDALESVITYDQEAFEVVYCRDDLSPAEVETAFAAFHDRLIMRQIWIDDAPDIVLGDAGSDDPSTIGLSCLGYWFDEALIVQFPAGRHGGTVASIDPDADVSTAALREVRRDW